MAGRMPSTESALSEILLATEERLRSGGIAKGGSVSEKEKGVE